MAKRCSAIRPMAVCKQPWHGQLCKRRSEEHTSELQSQSNIVCRLLLEKKKNRYQLVAICFAVVSTASGDFLEEELTLFMFSADATAASSLAFDILRLKRIDGDQHSTTP